MFTMLSKHAIPRQRPLTRASSSCPASFATGCVCRSAKPVPCWSTRHLGHVNRRGDTILTRAHSLTLELAPQQTSPTSSDPLIRVASLASAWAKVSRKLVDTDGVPDVVIKAIRLALVWLEGAPLRRDGRDPFSRTVQLAVTLAELASVGLPLCSRAIAASVVVDAASEGNARLLDHNTIRQKLGETVASLVHDILRVRAAPQRVELFDDTAASAIREWCIASHDVRACVVEVVSRLDELQNMSLLPAYERQQLALEALQVYAPLGHALGMGAVSAAMEDICFQVLFPESYMHTSEWLRTVVDPAEDALYSAQQQLLTALDTHPRFNQLASGCILRARTKSLFSMFKKLLRLGDMSKGGRKPAEVFDLLGMRAVVQQRTDLPSEEAELAAQEACYIVKQVAEQLWSIMPGRTKDYIRRPKANGYSGIHITVCMQSVMQATSNSGSSSPCEPVTLVNAGTAGEQSGSQGQGTLGKAPYLELQIRTQSMDDRAETGDAAHTAYKGGLDSRQARQLQAWSQELKQRLAFKPQGKLLLPPSVVARQTGAYSVLDSVDIDADVLPLESYTTVSSSNQEFTSTSRIAVSTSTTTTTSFPATAQGPTDVLPAVEASSTHASSNRHPNPAISQLFQFMDRNGDGRLSLEELKEQLREVAVSASPAASPTDWLTTPYGAISFDHAADVSAMSWGSSWGSMSMSDSSVTTIDGVSGLLGGGGSAVGGGLDLDLDELLRQVVGKEAGEEVESLSLDEFTAFLKHLNTMRKGSKNNASQHHHHPPPSQQNHALDAEQLY